MNKINDIKIRRAEIKDAEILARIGWKSFHDAFAAHPANHPDDMKIYMDEAFSVAAIENDFREPDTIYLIAEIETQAVGYAKIKPDSREEGVSGKRPIELCRLYSLDEYIGKGIGKSLMLECLRFAETNENDVFWLGVWEFNIRAQEFYKQFGFEKCGEHIFQLGTDPQTDWVFQRKI